LIAENHQGNGLVVQNGACFFKVGGGEYLGVFGIGPEKIFLPDAGKTNRHLKKECYF
jgi:hypothetical protein